ncbi:MAG: hypothetical protein Ta2B_27620 [Termitinemataceae bacterium]|nr:MAG: hypothetical protein Ta2B_27620 [Termitinemataceae bacterium]
MNLNELFQGVAVIIDDEIGVDEANINTIIAQIESKNIPVKTYKELPNNSAIQHLTDISFLLLDWQLNPHGIEISDAIGGITISDTSYEEENIRFIRDFSEQSFCPIFIFSNLGIDPIKTKLIENNLFSATNPNRIFIKNKKDIQSTDLFSEIESWLQSTPSMYVLKKWQCEYKKSEMSFFNDFQHFSQYWPLVMWECFTTDGVDPSIELGELITQNVFSRMSPFKFCNDILNKPYPDTVDKQELRKILEGERFLLNDRLDKYDIGTGDLFKETVDEKEKYWLNIRAQCDLLRGSKQDEIELYCLKGRIVDEASINAKDGITVIEGQFIDNINKNVIPFIDGGKIVEFLFRDIKIKKWKELKTMRIGRILPPYINRVQQRYSLYLQRQGLPRIPNKAISPIAESTQ